MEAFHSTVLQLTRKDREEVTREGDYPSNDDDEEEEDAGEWDDQGEAQDEIEAADVKDESAAYLEFLTEEVTYVTRWQ